MDFTFRVKYNLSRLSKDLRCRSQIKLCLSSTPGGNNSPEAYINLPEDCESNLLPTDKFQNIGRLDSGNFFFYEEEKTSKYKDQLLDPHLVQKIKSFLHPFKRELNPTTGEFYFHGSALTALILEHIFNRPFSFSNINILTRINSFHSPSHHMFYKQSYIPSPKENSGKNFAYLGSNNAGGLRFDYIVKLKENALDLTNFLKTQPFNYSAVYFDLQSASIHWDEKFLSFLESFTIELNPQTLSLNTFIQGLRISQSWQCNFYPLDYAPFFINALQNQKGHIGEINFLKENHYKGRLYQFDSVSTYSFELKDKNYQFYAANPSLPWLQPNKAVSNSLLVLVTNSCLKFSMAQNHLNHKIRAINYLYTVLGINYLTLSPNFFTNYEDYLVAGNFEWESKYPNFWVRFIFDWRMSPVISSASTLQIFLKTHSGLKARLIEFAHYRSIKETWSFFDQVLSLPKRNPGNFHRFVGYLENHLSLAIHRLDTSINLFTFIYQEFTESRKRTQDRFLYIPLFLPWYLKPLVKELSTAMELDKEGTFMNHCVSGYDSKVEKNLCRIFHLETGMGHSTLELSPTFDVIQHKGFSNNPPRSKNLKLEMILIRFLKAKYGEIRKN